MNGAETAPAKVNLSLHVVGRRADGYHLLDGLVVFTGAGDRLAIENAEADRLTVTGPMAGGLADGENILTRALGAVRARAVTRGVTVPPVAIELEKHLPVAAGIGGGSADAGALLRLLSRHHPPLAATVEEVAPTLGADVPMCLRSVPARTRGVGDIVEPIRRLPPVPMVLVNPRLPLETPRVFQALETAGNAPPPTIPAEGFRSRAALLDFLRRCRNDLESPAKRLVPAIGDALDALRAAGASLVRMSGSGATVFALFEKSSEAHDAERTIRSAHPGWWTVATAAEGTEKDHSK